MKRLSFLILTALALVLGSACASGTLEVNDGGEEEDVGTGEPDSDISGDTDASENSSECFTPNLVECTGDAEYRECDPIGDFVGNWTDPISCPTDHTCNTTAEAGDPCEPLCTENHPFWGESCTSGLGVCQRSGTMTKCDGDLLVCDATPGDPEPKACNGEDSNCDGEIDSEDICSTCVEDEFGPENHSYQGAAALFQGDILVNLILCDNKAPSGSQNWFFLGETDNIHVHLEWEADAGPLGLEIHTGSFPQYHADAGTAASELTHQESLDEVQHVFVKVYFRTDEKPPAGAHYTISRPD